MSTTTRSLSSSLLGNELVGLNQPREPLRVALIAGTLGQGGAEKQLTYMARALREANVEVRIYCLTSGEFYESVLTDMGLQPTWTGRYQNPLLRLAALSRAIRRFRPHILQSIHFFTNLYTALISKQLGIVGIGSIRNDTVFDMKSNAFWGRWLLRTPEALILNSYSAKRTAQTIGVGEEKLHVLPNVLNLTDFDARFDQARDQERDSNSTVVMAVGRLVPQKRWERFVTAFAESRRKDESLKGVIVGDGPERANLESIAQAHQLAEHLSFLGRRDDVPALLKKADMLVLCSDNEGFPNVVLEAMAARLPVITTPAGDAASVVQDGTTGYVVPFDDQPSLIDRIVQLGESRELRDRMGAAGRKRVEAHYSFELLAPRLLSIYREIAVRRGRKALFAPLAVDV